MIFDNAKIQIEMGENKVGRTQIEYKKDVDISNQQYVKALFDARNLKKEILNGPTPNLDNNIINK